MHIPVLLHEVIEGLNLKRGDVIVDATINGGGHSSEIALRFGAKIKIIGFDVDADALERAKKQLRKLHANFILIHKNFVMLRDELQEKGYRTVNAFIFDLGYSSTQ